MNFELTQFELSLYVFQQFISRSLYLNFYLKQRSFFLLLFLSGFFTSFNPCMFSMLPISLSYVSSSNDKSINHFSFFLGLSSSSILFLIFFALLNHQYHSLFINLPVISSCITVILGLFLLNIFQVRSGFNLTVFSFIATGPVRSYFWGFFLGINTSPCSTPILLTLLLLLSSSNDYLLVTFYIIVYLLGYISTLLLLAFLILRLRFVYRKSFYLTSSIFISLSGCTVLSCGILRLLERIFL